MNDSQLINYTTGELIDMAERRGVDIKPMRKWLIDSIEQNENTRRQADYTILIEVKGRKLTYKDGAPMKFVTKGDATIGDVRKSLARETGKALNDIKFGDVMGLRAVDNLQVSSLNVGNERVTPKKLAGNLDDDTPLSVFYPFTQLTFVLNTSWWRNLF